jgi:PTH1 family peptidyl-tRNA hydrolase
VPGKIRVKLGGGHGGHNGLRDITRHIGADFWRVRIGVGHPGHKDAVEGYVLRDFAKDERKLMEKIIDAVAGAVPMLVEDNEGEFMNRVAREINPPRPAKPKPPKPQPPNAPGDGNEPAEAGDANSSAGGPRKNMDAASSKDSNGL